MLPLGSSNAAPDDEPFSALRGFEPTGSRVRVEPREFSATRVDLPALRAELPAGDDAAVVDIPSPDGTLQSFRVQRSQTMEPELAAAHPEIATWSGVGVDDPTASIALDITPMGFHAFVRTPAGTRDWYVDPAYDRRGTTQHLSYFGTDLPAPAQARNEGEVAALRDTVEARQAAERAANAPVQRRFYRLALTSDPSYAAYFGTANVLAEKVTLINRVNEIYNNDLSVNLRLVNATDALNFDSQAEATGANGPCGAAPCFRLGDPRGPGPRDDIPADLEYCSGLTLGQNRTVLGQLVGASSYDVGHIALGSDGGGGAYLGVIGGDYKGGGCTGLSDPRGDFFAVDYVAHEIGHQFGGNHTFDGTQHNCADDNRAPEASVEPGSGSSVMAYAGICRQDNLQSHSDPYFSHKSQEQIFGVMQQPQYDNIEVQTVSLRGFDAAGESIRLSFGAAPAQTITYEDYDAASLDAAITTLTGRPVSIAEWGFDEFGLSETPSEPSPVGFQVIFNDTPTVQGADPSDVDVASLSVDSTTPGVSGFVGETAKGGKSQNGGTLVASDNRNPQVAAPDDRTLPMRTPFALTATGSDPDGNPLVYLWEQNDLGGPVGTALVSNTKIDGPLFRVFGTAADVSETDTLKSPSPGLNIADGNPTRVFPDMAQILSGNTNAASGTCPPAPPLPPPGERVPPVDPVIRECFSEFLPVPGYVGTAGSTSPAMHFRVTVRDLFVTGGGTTFDDVTLNLDPSAGPFLVTSQATAGTTVAGGTAVPVTWAVNNTQRLAANVRISLSTDGGRTFGTVLTQSTPNDGSETLTMPNVTAAAARIKIEAVDNYFFDVNDQTFALRATPAPETTLTRGPVDGSVVLARRQRIAYSSSVDASRFVCTVDDETVACDAAGLSKKFRAGTHRVTVAAVNRAGVVDPTPAAVTFTVPRDFTTFVREGAWARKRDNRAFSGDYLFSRRTGSQLVTRVPATEEIALVVGTGRPAGVVRVFLGKRRIATVRLGGDRAFRQLRTITLPKARKGKLRIVVARNRPVRIEGVAIVTDLD